MMSLSCWGDLTRSTSGCGLIALTSPFFSAGTSWVASVMMRKTSVSKLAPPPHHLVLGTSVTAWFFWNLVITYGPADQVGTVVLKKVVMADRPALVVSLPCLSPT